MPSVLAGDLGGTNIRLAIVSSDGGPRQPVARRDFRSREKEATDGQVGMFWGDVRYVPPTDPCCPFRRVKETFLDYIPMPPANVHPKPTTVPDFGAAARPCDEFLSWRFPGPWSRLDLVLLGLAADGHIASLFPVSPALGVSERRVDAIRAATDPPRRLTITLPVINHASLVFLLVAGKGNAGSVLWVLVGPCDQVTCPAASVHPEAGWSVDGAAATFFSPSVRAPSPPA
jgi:6-phosphogluconolactonase